MPEVDQPLLFGAQLREHLRKFPDNVALSTSEEALTYRELYERAVAIAARLQVNGYQPGDRISLLAEAHSTVMEVTVAALLLRCAVVPLSTSVQPDTLRGLIEDCAPVALFIDAKFIPLYQAASGGIADVVVMSDVDEAYPWPTLTAWLAQSDHAFEPVEADPMDILTIIYSSGTTGVPKGITHPSGSRCAFWAEHGKIGVGMGPGTKFVLTTALYTTGTFITMLGMFYNGGEAVVLRKFDPEEFLRLAEQGKGNASFLVPVQVRRILELPSFSPERVAGMRLTTIAGSVCDAATKARLAREWGGDVIELYGMSETNTLSAIDLKAEPGRHRSVGKIVATAEVIIINDDGEPVPVGTVGEIVAWTPYMMKQYYNRPDLTAGIEWRNGDGRVFWRTGDVGFIDTDGYLHVTDRKKDMIVSGGANIFASDIEAVLLAHPEINDCAVIAIPSERWGESPYGVVALTAGSMLNDQDLLDWANARLGKMARLVGVEIRPELPRNQMGKLMKKEMREPFWEGHELRVA